MAEDRSLYYKLKLFDPEGNEVSRRTLRIYPEISTGKKEAEMQGAKLGIEMGLDAMHNAKTGWVSA